MSSCNFGKYRQIIDRFQQEDFRVEPADSHPSQEVVDFEQALATLGQWLNQRFTEHASLQKISVEISRGSITEDVLDKIYLNFQQIIPYDRIGCALLTEDQRLVKSFWTKARYGEENLMLSRGFTAALAGSSLESTLLSGQPRIINDLEAYLAAHPASTATRLIFSEGIRSSLTCPLIADGKPLGFIFFSSLQADTYREIHQNAFLFIAQQVSVLIEKSKLYQHILELNTRLNDTLQELKRQSCRDSLTGVLHRGAINEFLAEALGFARRKQQSLSIIMADIDHFKQVNDTYGHIKGDEVLRAVSHALQDNVRAYDAIGRFGGEEFLIVLRDTPADQAMLVAERMRIAILQLRFLFQEQTFGISASFGLATLDTAMTTCTENFIELADKALYQAKHAGRNCICHR